MADLNTTRLQSEEIGAAPLVRAFIERLGLETLLAKHLLRHSLGRKPSLKPAVALSAMVANILLSRAPLYAVPGWLDRYASELFGLKPGQERFFNDDRIGRNLDTLFQSDHASLTTALLLNAIRAFDIDLSQLHNDSTTVTFSGKYDKQTEDDQAPHITFGYNKDHRPDLKQLVYSLSITSDGAVPIHFKTYAGNTSDDRTHVETWTTLCQLTGSVDFLYVADSKLCVSETMRHIDKREGRFLTVMPATRSEERWFKSEYLPAHVIDWREVRRDRCRQRKGEPDNVYEGFESPSLSKEGFRILWYKSSQKLIEDQDRRHNRMAVARMKVELLECRKRPFKSIDAAGQAAEKILDAMNVSQFLKVRAVRREFDEFRQLGPGRPGPNTLYERDPVSLIVFEIEEDQQAIQEAAAADGLFPLITNCEDLSLEEALAKYKYQPFLEKRNEQLKSVLEVAPVHLKKPERVASLLCLYFVALLIYALIERELRRQMKHRKIDSLPLYPESRSCKAPTADLAFSAFAGLRRHHLLDASGNILKTFHDPLSPVCQQVLSLLDIDPSIYGPAA